MILDEPVPPIVQGRSLMRRRAVLDAALDSFAERGFDTTSIEDICRGAETSVGSVYHHFGSKAGVAAALYLDVLEDFQRSLVGAMDAGPDARRWIGSIVGAQLRWVEAHVAGARFLQQFRHAEWLAPSGASLRALNAAFAAAIAEAARRHVRSGALRSCAPDIFIALLLGPTHEFIRGWLAGRTTTPLGSARRLLADACWHALGATAVAPIDREKP